MSENAPSEGMHESAKVILIVEDDEDIGTFLVEAISQETPYHPMWVMDGFAALKILHGLKPDLLILDYQLPEMNGIELYDKIRTIPGYENVPALLMTASIGMPWSQIEKRALVGLPKPLELGEFLATVDNLLAPS
jgi:CheY-like chemotaxis protein